jgi:DNA-binding NarL/FixJ family response regulator
VKVVIADRDELTRSLLEYWISAETSAEIVGETSTGDDVVDIALENRADLLVIDPLITGKSGFLAVKELRHAKPDIRMLALYAFDKPFLVDMLRKVGFHGCVSKTGNNIPKLRQAVLSVMDGNAYYCAETCRILNKLYSDPKSFVHLLSLREQEVLCLVADGWDNEKIGERFKLSPATVQTHRRNLFKKLEIHDTPSLMCYAINQGFSPCCIDGSSSFF